MHSLYMWERGNAGPKVARAHPPALSKARGRSTWIRFDDLMYRTRGVQTAG